MLPLFLEMCVCVCVLWGMEKVLGKQKNILVFFIFQDTAREILKNAPGVVIIDDRASNNFPTPLEVSNKDAVAVGRIRRDVSQEGNYG